MASCRRLTTLAARLLVALTLALHGFTPTFASDETALISTGHPRPPPWARLHLAESDVARIVVDGKAIHLQLKAPARARLRAMTAATVGGRLTVSLDGRSCSRPGWRENLTAESSLSRT